MTLQDDVIDHSRRHIAVQPMHTDRLARSTEFHAQVVCSMLLGVETVVCSIIQSVHYIIVPSGRPTVYSVGFDHRSACGELDKVIVDTLLTVRRMTRKNRIGLHTARDSWPSFIIYLHCVSKKFPPFNCL